MKTLTYTQLLEVARNQKQILWLLLASVVVVIAAFCIPSNRIVGVLILTAFGLIGIISTVSLYRLAKALDVAWPWLYVVCAFIPYVNTVTLLFINFRATASLKRRGIPVGLMGADNAVIENLKLTAQLEAASNAGPGKAVGGSSAGPRPPSMS